MSEERACKGCGIVYPRTLEFFGSRGRRPKGGQYLSSHCRDCEREINREKSRNYQETLRKSPEKAERRKARRRENDAKRNARPETRAKHAENERRWRSKRRKSASLRKADREVRRIDVRLRHEKSGRDISEIEPAVWLMKNSTGDRKDAFPRLPAGPLARAIDECDARRQNEFFAGFTANWQRSRTSTTYTSEIDSLGIAEKTDSAERMVYGWRNGERLDANFDTVDAVLTRGRWLWWEVYNPETVRKHALMVTVRRRIEKRSRPQAHHPVAGQVTVDGQRVWRVRHSMYATAARMFLGDLGTDWERLWEVEHAFTCEGIDHCWACHHRQQEENERERERRQGEQLELAEAA